MFSLQHLKKKSLDITFLFSPKKENEDDKMGVPTNIDYPSKKYSCENKFEMSNNT